MDFRRNGSETQGIDACAPTHWAVAMFTAPSISQLSIQKSFQAKPLGLLPLLWHFADSHS
eukprot:3813012-Lingulodinium_polyedra.AAC.1